MNLSTPERILVERAPDPLAAALHVVERLLPRVARRLLFDVATDSPLWDLPLPQMRTLYILSHRSHCPMGVLAERLGVAMSTVTQIADRLEQRGWVRRVDDPEDRRVVRLGLTEEGVRMMEERRQERRERLAEALGRMPADKRQALVEGLQSLSECGGGGTGRERACMPGRSLLDWVREDLETAPADEERAGTRVEE